MSPVGDAFLHWVVPAVSCGKQLAVAAPESLCCPPPPLLHAHLESATPMLVTCLQLGGIVGVAMFASPIK